MDPTPFDEALIVDARPAPPGDASRQIVHALGARRTLLADNVRSARQMVRDRQPGLVVIELDTLGQAGIALIRRLATGHPAVRLLVLSDSDATMAPVQALRAGAHGFVPRQRDLAEMVRAARGVMSGYLVFPAQTLEAARLLRRPPAGRLARLTARELTVLQYLARGHSNKTIAALLLISSKTVSAHKTNIMCKLNVGSVVEMVDYARQHCLL
ncbi:Virulence factors putative positive transcription regulator BvgA [Cupriavidus yeoncheonensis]|uniref:Virulence factors putative positive transcription regulator BvgA n=1 Tax=Cupriavidus yeoncheonensis TaxID=1462994 RepID=A0A916IWD2_9BURK|nr:LuxR C-terminal-related transcriptional regulator [Cupriavidus yeoncheonensis]CAG2149162.1 Virulence factors putative positive transcription regulator BvgA [Cupriavidus yeoncheonensis]